jgi:hypothetical protein
VIAVNDKNNLEFELCQTTVIIHQCPNRNTIHAWDPFGSFSQWEVGQAPLYDSMNYIVGYTSDFVEYFISIWKHQLHHDDKSLLIGTGHITDFPNASTELFCSRGICPIAEIEYRNRGWEKWL